MNTNLYAEIKRSSSGGRRKATNNHHLGPKANTHCRVWRATTAAELKVWFGLIIKMGLHQESSPAQHCSKEGRNGWRKTSTRPLLRQRYLSSRRRYRVPKNCMSLTRFEQIKRYLHVSDPRIELDRQHWYKKLSPLAEQLQEHFRQYFVPGTKVATNEMMVRFFWSKSSHFEGQEQAYQTRLQDLCLMFSGVYVWVFMVFSISRDSRTC